MKNSDKCAKKATVIGIEMSVRKEKDENVDAVQIPRRMTQGGRDQKIEIPIPVDATMIIVRGEGIKRRNGGGGIATRGRVHQMGGGIDIDTMKDETSPQISGLHWGIAPNVN